MKYPSRKEPLSVHQLGACLSLMRRMKGMSLRDVAKESEVSAATLSRIEDGAPFPDLKSLMRVARWLDLEITVTPREKT